MSDVSRVLERAADLVERGWCQKSFTRYLDGQSHYCLYGAVEKAVEKDADELADKRIYAAMARLGKHLSLGGGNLLYWNDAPNRTQSEVVAALRGAAKEADRG